MRRCVFGFYIYRPSDSRSIILVPKYNTDRLINKHGNKPDTKPFGNPIVAIAKIKYRK